MGVGDAVFHPRRNSIATLPNPATRPQALNSWGLRSVDELKCSDT
jgi:hypothetical protein